MLYTFDQIRGGTGRWALHVPESKGEHPCADGSHLRSTDGKKYEISSGDFKLWTDFTSHANGGYWRYKQIYEQADSELTAAEAMKRDGTYQCVGDKVWTMVVLSGKGWWYNASGKHSLVPDPTIPSMQSLRFRRIDVTKTNEVPKLNIKRTRLLLCDTPRPR